MNRIIGYRSNSSDVVTQEYVNYHDYYPSMISSSY